jgi:imidazoleglycerol-phosphate dehydratase
MSRSAALKRKTNETDVSVELDLDGSVEPSVSTGVGFFDHMLTHLGKHGGFSLTVQAKGDTHIDDHHTVEDVGLAFGAALKDALGDKKGVQRYGSCTLPMDETLVTVAVDLSGRPAFVWKVSFPTEKIGAFDCQLAEEFWKSVANAGLLNLHVVLHHGTNSHHIAEAVFKAAARALRAAVAFDDRNRANIPSTKGVL